MKNAKIYSQGLIRKGAILIDDGIIKHILFYNASEENYIKFNDPIIAERFAYSISRGRNYIRAALYYLNKLNEDGKKIDCKNKLILPGIIDIHSHLRDMGQSKKETFLSGTKAAAFSGITTVFNMPNTIPPAITSEQVKLWMEKAENNIYVDVGFIAGIPKGINQDEIKLIIDLGIIGFKIYPLDSISDINWKDPKNIQKILDISSKFQIPIFIHASYPLSEEQKDQIKQEFDSWNGTILDYHNKFDSVNSEEKYVNFVIENYNEYITINRLNPRNYPIIHFCHVSCIQSYLTIKKATISNKNLKISFEVTPHHLLLSNKIRLSNENFGKVLPPLRGEEHPKFLFNELREGNINLIGTDHAPHRLDEKANQYFNAPSGFPGFETYPLLMLKKVFDFQLPLARFVEATSENPAKLFNLRKKGFIKVGYDADLFIVDKVKEY
ncbi:MAG: dihydroorotase family protein, partial [Promethearchaeota archaeon]